MDERAEFERRYWPGARPGRPPQLVATTERGAWALHRTQEGRYSYPQPVGPSMWILYPSAQIWPEVGQVDTALAEEAQKLRSSAPPSPGSSAEAAKLQQGDRERITQRVQQSRRRQAQRSDPDQAPQKTLW